MTHQPRLSTSDDVRRADPRLVRLLVGGHLLRLPLGLDPAQVVVHLVLGLRHGPPEQRRHQVRGRFKIAAQIKLEHFDLWSPFPWGAFGEDGAHRNALLPVALERARRLGHEPISPRHVLVIGDTPHDVACAHAGGAVAMAVATGTANVGELRASGAEIVVDDLSDVSVITEWLSS